MSRRADQDKSANLYEGTRSLIQREKARRAHLTGIDQHAKAPFVTQEDWDRARPAFSVRSEGHYRDAHDISGREHMSEVDPFDGGKVRGGSGSAEMTVLGQDDNDNDDLLVIHPVIDGRLLDKGRQEKTTK